MSSVLVLRQRDSVHLMADAAAYDIETGEAMHQTLNIFIGASLESGALDRARLGQLFSDATKVIQADPARGTESHRRNVCIWMNSYLSWFDQEADSPQKRPMPFRLIQGGKADDVQPEPDAPEEKKE